MLEQPEIKGPVLKTIESAARPDAIIGSNTSTLPIGDLAVNLTHAERFLGIHFSNPAPFIPGVELIAHSGTTETVVQSAEAVVALTGKLSARVNDKAGFVLNRLQYVLLKEAINLVEEGRRNRGGHRHRGAHDVWLPASVLRPVRHRRHGRPGYLPGMLSDLRGALRRAAGRAGDAHRAG